MRVTVNHRRIDRAARGFTLIELMVVVAIVAILVVVAVLSISPQRYAGGTVGYAEEVAGALENMRVRAVSTRKWQRLEVDASEVIHLEAVDEGMAKPATDDDWYVVKAIQAPSGVYVHAVDSETHVLVDKDVPAEGVGLAGAVPIDFAPDGAGTKATIFIGDEAGERQVRIAIWAASGAATIFEDW